MGKAKPRTLKKGAKKESLRKTKSMLWKAVRDLTVEVTELRERCGRHEGELMDRRNRMAIMYERHDQFKVQVEALENERTSTNRTLEIAQTNVRDLDDLAGRLTNEKEALRKDHQQILLFSRLCLIPLAALMGPLVVASFLAEIQKNVQFPNDDGLDVYKMALRQSAFAYDEIVILMRDKKLDPILTLAFIAAQIFPPKTP